MTAAQLPDGWEWLPLKQIAAPRLGGNYRNRIAPSARPLIKMGNIARIRMDLSRLEYIPANEKVLPEHRLRYGDVLLNTRNTLDLVGKVSIWRNELPRAYYNSNILRLEFRHEYCASSVYFGYALNSKSSIDAIRSLATGTTSVAAVYTRDLLKLRLPVPPKEEQSSIASVLIDIDDLITTLDRLITKTQAIKHGMMQKLLTGKTRLPGFNRPWTEVRLGNHVGYIKTVALSRAQLDSQSPSRYLHYGDIHTSASVRLDAAHHEMPRAKSALVRNAGRLQVGDLVFADASEDQDGVGKSVEIISVPKEGVIPGLHTIAARFDKSVLANGFTAYLQFNPQFRSALLRLVAGTKVLATTRSYISSVQLSLPGVDEQRAIARVLLDADGEVFALQEKLHKARAIKQGIMQELLTGRIRLPVKEPAA